MGGRAQRLARRCIADDHDGGLCFEPVVVVVVVAVAVAGGAGAGGGWCWCRERRQAKRIKKLEGGWGGGRSASPQMHR